MLLNNLNVVSFACLVALAYSAPIARGDDEARTLSPISNSGLCLQLRSPVFLDNNYVNYLTL